MKPDFSRKEKQLVLVGGGHAHIEVLRLWARQPLANVRLVLVSPSADTYYSGMLPGYISGIYSREAITIDLQPLADRAGAIFYRSQMKGIDTEAKVLYLQDEVALPYDVVSLDIGSKALPAPFSLESPFALATRPFSNLLNKLAIWDDRQFSCDLDERMARDSLLCVGAGAAGFEILLALKRRYPEIKKFYLLDKKTTLHSGQLEFLSGCGVDFALGVQEYEISTKSSGAGTVYEVRFPDGRLWSAARVVWAVGAGGHEIAELGGKRIFNDRGFVPVGQDLQALGASSVFAVGDCADFSRFAPWVTKAGVYPVRAARTLYLNLRASLVANDHSLNALRPQRSFLRLLNYSDGSAEFIWRGVRGRGVWPWRLKNWIDQRFMAKYRDLALSPMVDPNCGGCGAKLGGESLKNALRKGLAAKFSHPEDVSLFAIESSRYALSTDTIRSFLVEPARLGTIIAQHSFSDFYASGIAPRAATLNVTLDKLPARIAEADLAQIVRAVEQSCVAEGVQLTGGQTLEGMEPTVGLTVFSPLPESFRPWSKRPSDDSAACDLILTKALGTGAILAGQMRAATNGADMERALKSMELSNRAAYLILKKYAIAAATDITGFGLVGHAAEMIAGSRMRIKFDWSALPILPGAERLLTLGYRSRMHELNRSYASSAAEIVSSETPEIAFDPQTSGGLLIAIPKDRSQACLGELRTVYENAAIVGSLFRN